MQNAIEKASGCQVVWLFFSKCKHDTTKMSRPELKFKYLRMSANIQRGSFLISLSGARVTKDILWSFTAVGDIRFFSVLFASTFAYGKMVASHLAVIKNERVGKLFVPCPFPCTHVSHKSYKKQHNPKYTNQPACTIQLNVAKKKMHFSLCISFSHSIIRNGCRFSYFIAQNKQR